MDEILGHQQRVLIAIKNGKIVGTLIVSAETEAEGVGNVGCTCVASNETHQGIATNMVKLGTASGYEISTYYFMGEKVITALCPMRELRRF